MNNGEEGGGTGTTKSSGGSSRPTATSRYVVSIGDVGLRWRRRKAGETETKEKLISPRGKEERWCWK